MKTLTMAMIAVAFLVLAGCGSVPFQQSYAAQVQPIPQPNAALVYFYNFTHFRISLFSNRNPLDLAILEGGQSGRELAEIGPQPFENYGTYTWLYLPPGPHTFTAMSIGHSGNGIRTRVVLGADRTYYFEVIVRSAAWVPDIQIRRVADATDAIETMRAYKYCPEQACDNPNWDKYYTTYRHYFPTLRQ